MKPSNISVALLFLSLCIALLWGCSPSGQTEEQQNAPTPGYRGIWDSNQPNDTEYRYKYSGGLGTYPQQHIPIAIYSPEAQKTFFVYGGAQADTNLLAYMVGCFDHKTQKISRPVQISTKDTQDAHDNPVLSIDQSGHLWVFANSHGIERPSFIYKSAKPYDITSFVQTDSTNFSYSQPWFVPQKGFVWLQTRYQGSYQGRYLYAATSPDGQKWSDLQPLAAIEEGSYQVSWSDGQRVATAFDYHPKAFWGREQKPGYMGLNHRANIYFAITPDGGATWQNIRGETLSLPLTQAENPALALNSFQDRQLVYLKDIAFDAAGHPLILYIRSNGYEAGPENDPRTWHILRWDGQAWKESAPIARSDNNYDHGSLYVEPDGTWRIIGPVLRGPQPYNPGGEMAMLVSTDQGANCQVRPLTQGSAHNHTYARKPLNAHPDFYALWADGHARQPSESKLYFCNQQGEVFVLPTQMTADWQTPEKLLLK